MYVNTLLVWQASLSVYLRTFHVHIPFQFFSHNIYFLVKLQRFLLLAFPSSVTFMVILFPLRLDGVISLHYAIIFLPLILCLFLYPAMLFASCCFLKDCMNMYGYSNPSVRSDYNSDHFPRYPHEVFGYFVLMGLSVVLLVFIFAVTAVFFIDVPTSKRVYIFIPLVIAIIVMGLLFFCYAIFRSESDKPRAYFSLFGCVISVLLLTLVAMLMAKLDGGSWAGAGFSSVFLPFFLIVTTLASICLVTMLRTAVTPYGQLPANHL
jgi:hypothetical protein